MSDSSLDSQSDSALSRPVFDRPVRVLFAGWEDEASSPVPLALKTPLLDCIACGAGEIFLPSNEAEILVLRDADTNSSAQATNVALRQRFRVVIGVGAGEPEASLLSSLFDDWLPESAMLLLEGKLLAWRQMLLAQDIQEQWRDLERVERMKNEFLATVHHELRTPLTSILGSLSLINGKVAGELPPKAGLLIEMAFRNAQRLSRLIDDVLDVAKLEEERIELHRKVVDVRPLLEEALAANQSFADKVGVQLLLEVERPAQIRVDPDRFSQVLANLLSNAIKHSKAGDGVRVKCAIEAAECRVSVIDQGPGVPAEFMKRLFEKFSQADGSDRRARGGTGLGLYISRLLVQRMAGTIGVESEPGKGACFYVSFPLEEGRSGHE
jgi:signal transduction histidine kinase